MGSRAAGGYASFPKKERVWIGISLNVGAETVRWSESAVQRIAGILVLWWYFYATEKSQVTSFLKKIYGLRSNEEFPKAKELVAALVKGLRSVVVRPDEEPEEEEIQKRVEKRLRDLILLALNKAAPAEDISEEEETNGEGIALLERQAETTPEGGEAAGEEGK